MNCYPNATFKPQEQVIAAEASKVAAANNR